MREVLQSLRAASIDLADVAEPRPGPGQLLIRTVASVVSAGTERMLVEFAGANLVGKARQQPERVKEVAAKARTDGLMTTVDAVRSKLNKNSPASAATNAAGRWTPDSGVYGWSQPEGPPPTSADRLLRRRAPDHLLRRRPGSPQA